MWIQAEVATKESCYCIFNGVRRFGTEQILSGVETVDLDEPSEPSEETDDRLSNTDQ